MKEIKIVTNFINDKIQKRFNNQGYVLIKCHLALDDDQMMIHGTQNPRLIMLVRE